MRTKQRSSQCRVPRTSLLLTLTTIILFSCSQQSLAQQWSTNGNDISNTNTGNVGIGTTSPAQKLEISSVSPLIQMSDTSSIGVKMTFGTTGFWSGFSANRNLATGSHFDTGKTTAGYFMFVSNGNSFHWWGTTPTNDAEPTERMRLDKDGNLGIGTNSPLALLDVRNSDGLFYAGFGYGTNKDTYIRAGSSTTGGLHLGDLNTTKTLLQENGGNVGIGTATPNSQYKLDVAGNINSSGTITGNNIVAKYQDVAEWVESSQELPAGTVVVVDHTKSNQVTASLQAYDTRVAGVISAQPGIALGESGDNKVLVATTGRVLVNVDATNGPIQIGDLLVTSDRAGFAMKSLPVEIGDARIHRPGTLIGKALEPLASGTGKILMLLSLQ